MGSTCRCVRDTNVSITAPLSSLSRCTSSMISSRTRDATAASEPCAVKPTTMAQIGLQLAVVIGWMIPEQESNGVAAHL